MAQGIEGVYHPVKNHGLCCSFPECQLWTKGGVIHKWIIHLFIHRKIRELRAFNKQRYSQLETCESRQLLFTKVSTEGSVNSSKVGNSRH